jgi:hypothetical protein
MNATSTVGTVEWTQRTGGRLEAACVKATAAGDPSYRTVKGILAAGTETTAPTPRPAGDAGARAHLHGPAQLFADVIPLPTATGPDTGHSTTTTPAPADPAGLTSHQDAS